MEKSVFADLYNRYYESGNTIFHELARRGELRALYEVDMFITGPYEDLLQVKNYDGELCTHVAVKHNNELIAMKIMEALVLLGANLNGINASAGETVLHRAVNDGLYELTEWLCKQPAINLDARNDVGLTAYQIAYKRNDERLKEILREARADCEEPEKTSSKSSDGPL
ncbi:vankyrin-b3.1 [Ichnoviriform fugitivi]|uniref:Vankyrin-b3.1 n=1 Tax=Ichnoviriform fugitivi TaxID=265522 RepID=A2Q0D5_9VIRU|nr:vankyrin-b3.1 [Ichnoviriform fugitivi]BAF45650.1 vankyrin-b3.1 [Ichnoviriform fugitivi]